MSAEIDSMCPTCDAECTFSTGTIKGHSNRHRLATCPNCGVMVTGDCDGC